MNTAQAAEFLGLNDSRVRQMLRSGELRGKKIGRDWLIQRSEAERVKKERQEPQPKRPGRPPKQPKG